MSKAICVGLGACVLLLAGCGEILLGARSAVDILTNNELAQTIADLKAALQAFLSR